MPNLKIFAIILFFMSVLYVGLEFLPYHSSFVQTTHVEVQEVIETVEQQKRNTMGYTIIGYFLVVSLLLYIKIILQRTHHKEG
ncbi:hypothetical protein [Sulfurospirillum deleyianum]|uniref:Uncharacterized protein n=1 Tax=Sulfurospirillum deleyianum (strain ATCC 51133 / DSM 6946 / 5175) TaxID=525898 RepID=D1AZ16_SULD5|nr:hypothetical protein [Sulfurospirillum deleyianum]ACZ11154.1 hypothetical protein Sdel_0116 [Sulfurospirillum deleyianum DSM 6946]